MNTYCLVSCWKIECEFSEGILKKVFVLNGKVISSKNEVEFWLRWNKSLWAFTLLLILLGKYFTSNVTWNGFILEWFHNYSKCGEKYIYATVDSTWFHMCVWSYIPIYVSSALHWLQFPAKFGQLIFSLWWLK